MASFTFPADKLDFTAANGITYTWDAGDNVWRVRSFRSQDDIIVQVGDTPPDNPKQGDLWFDTNDDVQSLQVYVNDAWVPATDLSEYIDREEFEADQARQDEEIAKLLSLAVDRRVYTYGGVDAVPQACLLYTSDAADE